MNKKLYRSQFVNAEGNTITSEEVGIETKLFVTITDKDITTDKVKDEVESKLDENITKYKFQLMKEYTTEKGYRGLFYIVPDIM